MATIMANWSSSLISENQDRSYSFTTISFIFDNIGDRFYIDFLGHKIPKQFLPNYINVVRDPLERIVSHLYEDIRHGQIQVEPEFDPVICFIWEREVMLL